MCFNPVRLKQPDGSFRSFPCGKCLDCVRKYQQMWVARLREESKSWIRVNGEYPIVFITLTYSPENIPKNYLCISESGVHLTKQPIFPNLPAPVWNTVINEPIAEAKRRQAGLEFEFKSDLQSYLLLTKDEFTGFESNEFENSDFEEDIPFEVFTGGDKFGKPLSNQVAFHSVRYSDVRAWLQSCRVKYSRKISPVFASSGKKVNPRYISEVDGRELPNLPQSFKYWITSEYGSRTFRPHYHGLFFGVTLKEFDEWFKPLWENRFGHVESSTFDPLKGGMFYVSKYCSKGSYDNPLCKKDFFYPNGKEYHSDKYEGSLLHFGVNLPLSDPTFHMISQGIGISYAFRHKVQKYWGVEIDDNFVTRDVLAVPVPSIPLEKCVTPSKHRVIETTYKIECSNSLFDKEITLVKPLFASVPEQTFKVVNYHIYEYSASGRLVADSILDCNLDGSYYQEVLSRKKYSRKFCYHPKDSEGKYLPEVLSATSSHSLPRYYRRWLLSPAARLHLAAASIRLDAEACEQFARTIRQVRDSDSLIRLAQSEEIVNGLVEKEAYEKLRKSAERFYSKLDFEDLKELNNLK